jgi:hypothetical protein
MRVKFNNNIYFCTKISCATNSKILLFATVNKVYCVYMKTPENAMNYYNKMLTEGYSDMSEYKHNRIF